MGTKDSNNKNENLCSNARVSWSYLKYIRLHLAAGFIRHFSLETLHRLWGNQEELSKGRTLLCRSKLLWMGSKPSAKVFGIKGQIHTARILQLISYCGLRN